MAAQIAAKQVANGKSTVRDQRPAEKTEKQAVGTPAQQAAVAIAPQSAATRDDGASSAAKVVRIRGCFYRSISCVEWQLVGSILLILYCVVNQY